MRLFARNYQSKMANTHTNTHGERRTSNVLLSALSLRFAHFGALNCNNRPRNKHVIYFAENKNGNDSFPEYISLNDLSSLFYRYLYIIIHSFFFATRVFENK